MFNLTEIGIINSDDTKLDIFVVFYRCTWNGTMGSIFATFALELWIMDINELHLTSKNLSIKADEKDYYIWKENWLFD